MGFQVSAVWRVISVIFDYETVKIVSIKNKKIGLLCRLIQLIIISYVIGYVIVYKKGYQDTESGISGIITKVKGVSLTNRSIAGGENIWDVADYVIPPQETNAFFITTNALVTRKQTQAKCAEDDTIPGARCVKNSDCVAYEPIILGDGVKTGICLNKTVCEIYAWCPAESSIEDKETIKSPLLKNVNNFTVFIKNNLEFRKFKVFRSNIPTNYNKNLLNACRYNSSDTRCPIFQIETILKLANTNYDDISKTGGVISVSINWDCNLDINYENCFPTYSFTRLDSDNSKLSKGWNFRHANYYYINETQYRDLIKAYGLRFVISVSSKAGKFSIIPLTMALGSGLALLGIATVICDFVILYVFSNRGKYVKEKFHEVLDESYKPLESVNSK